MFFHTTPPPHATRRHTYTYIHYTGTYLKSFPLYTGSYFIPSPHPLPRLTPSPPLRPPPPVASPPIQPQIFDVTQRNEESRITA